MPNSLLELEAERSKVLRQLTTLGDLRTGSICAVPRRCGKPTCHCAKPNDPGHDPQIRLTRKVDGRTVAESFPSPSAWRKAQGEIDEYHRFQKLSAELIAINEKICMQRPLESESDAWTPEEKKRLLRSYGSLPGVTFQIRSHRCRSGGSLASLLLMPALPQRAVPSRCRTGH